MGEFSKEILKSPLISFVVINYNGGEYLSQCLSSIMEQGGDSECIVIDNCSSDDSLEIIKRFNVYLVVNKKNLGYPIAVNQGIKKAKGKYIFLLTPTTFLEIGSVNRMIELLTEDYIGAVAPRLKDKEGSTIPSIRAIPSPISFLWEAIGGSRFLPGREFFRPWKLPHFDYSKEQEVEQPMSCALLVKKKAIEEIGLFDERFFLYFSDVDFSKRLLKHYKTRYLPEASAIHIRGGTTKNLGSERIRIFHKDLIAYLRKHHPVSLLFIGVFLIVIGEIRYLCTKLIQSLGMGKK
ncbi:glycosyltransferase family 2 protein [candidate division WOR-3 bacterium]|nr:glycosyltransferase family 2 protein [candidate division WOR-3 bacterium]